MDNETAGILVVNSLKYGIHRELIELDFQQRSFSLKLSSDSIRGVRRIEKKFTNVIVRRILIS